MSAKFLNYQEFITDAELSLGRANGSIQQRIPGIPSKNDGQVMIRLKSKRFVVLDYSFVPSPEDEIYANQHTHAKLPPRAGVAICVNKNCQKVGAPVCLYDSSPTEPEPLYLRSGRCFQCQRNLNEQRRAERKRAPGSLPPPSRDADFIICVGSQGTAKRMKVGKSAIALREDAVIINGPVADVRLYGAEYGMNEIKRDLTQSVHDALQQTMQLMSSTSNDAVSMGTNEVSAAAVAAAAATQVLPEDPTGVQEEQYRKTFSSVSKTLFLLSQYKVAADAMQSQYKIAMKTLANPTAPATAAPPPPTTTMADAVAAAHAIVATTVPEPVPTTTTMESLLLAAADQQQQQQQHHDEELRVKVEDEVEEYLNQTAL